MGITMDIYEVELCHRGRWEQQDARFVAARNADEAAYKVTGIHLRSEGEPREFGYASAGLAMEAHRPSCFMPGDCKRLASRNADPLTGGKRLLPDFIKCEEQGSIGVRGGRLWARTAGAALPNLIWPLYHRAGCWPWHHRSQARH